jgi:glycosyltransferase involved in cell wall biosynthesis
MLPKVGSTMTIKGLIIGDSPKTHTGFAQVTAQFALALHNAGMDITVLGLLDHERDAKGELPYEFLPVPHLDDLAHNTFGHKISLVKPDFVMFITDPGNLHIYIYYMLKRKAGWFKKDDHDFMPAIVSYTPIEGWPVRTRHAEALAAVQHLGGTPVVYHEQAVELVRAQYPGIKPEFVHHGLDHAPWQRYSEEDRKTLRELCGFDKYFIIGTGGVNKRTKGWPQLIYTANEMNKMGILEKYNIRFYMHTSPTPVMYGHHLDDLIEYYGLEKYFLKRQKFDQINYWLGAARDSNTLAQARTRAGQSPDSPEGRGLMWMSYDFISMMNCFDMFLDLSQIEGWGFWPGEAMSCGVPTAIVKDLGIRDAIYGEGVYQLPSLPYRMWDTWESGARLVTIDPVEVATQLEDFVYSLMRVKGARESYCEMALACAAKYKWADSSAKMVEIVKQTVENDRKATEHEIWKFENPDMYPDHGWLGQDEGILGASLKQQS